MINPNEIIANGLVPFIVKTAPQPDAELFLTTLAEAMSGLDPAVLNHGAETALSEMEPSRFFDVQSVVVDLVPKLETDGRALLQLIATLVDAGGEDLLANAPNGALRDWCAQDDARSNAIIADARMGDSLAVRHLTFALEAASDTASALTCLRSGDADTRRAAVTALGRIKTSEQEALDAVAAVARSDEDETVALGALRASMDIATRNDGVSRIGLCDALTHRLAERSDDAIHIAADLLWRYGKTLPDDEFVLCLDTVRHVRSECMGTLRIIDSALIALRETPRLSSLAVTIREIIDGNGGQVKLGVFSSFTHMMRTDRSRKTRAILIDWLMTGDIHSRSSLTSVLSDIGRDAKPVVVEADDLPTDPAMQVFLCRKAVGFLFIGPRSAAAFPLAILRHGDKAAHGEALDALFDPLLMSYGGLVEYLEREIEAGHPAADALQALIEQKNAIHDGAKGARDLVELRPGQAQREIERTRHADSMKEATKTGEGESFFADLFTKQYLLYGRSSTFYVDDGAGELRKMEMPMHEYSVSTEFPMMEILDPVGLAMQLHQLRFERKPEVTQ